MALHHGFAVIADDREKDGGVIPVLAEREDVRLRIDRLEVGDYLFDSRLLFERKTLADFAMSIIDGRLFSQASRLVASGMHSVLILEERFRRGKACGAPSCHSGRTHPRFPDYGYPRNQSQGREGKCVTDGLLCAAT